MEEAGISGKSAAEPVIYDESMDVEVCEEWQVRSLTFEERRKWKGRFVTPEETPPVGGAVGTQDVSRETRVAFSEGRERMVL